jgi:FtsP/CotA-like multicopper oxidase with cupredoxin domain/fibronectin type 3 domain-containing protein
MPLVFQDRAFLDDGSFNFPAVGVQPAVHPYWVPEFFGDTIMVNGLVWPNMDVDQGVYRFRLLDGSNARFYTISFEVTSGPDTGLILPFTQIASDGGYLTAPVPLTELTFAPGERAEILVDFSGLAPDSTILVKNTANENWPDGLPVNPDTVGQLMQFTVIGAPGEAPPALPTPLNPTLPTFPTLGSPSVTRTLTLVEVLDPITDVPLELLLDGQAWLNPVYEIAMAGDTEEWIILNPTADSHPIHLHLVQFQVISRQPFDDLTYYPDWLALNGGTLPLTSPTLNLPSLAPYILGPEVAPPPTEEGWKDTIMMNPGEITRIRIRFAPTDAPISGPGAPTPGMNPYPFDPTLAPGYVWHCHIIDHEDNEMMRPMEIITAPPIEYSLTVNIVGSGSVSVNGSSPYPAGSVVQLTATPAAGWMFSGWSGDLSGSTNPEYLLMDSNKTVTATFTEIPTPTTLKFDFGTSTSPVQSGYTRVTDSTVYSAGLGYGWSGTSGIGSRDRGAPDSLRRDLVFSSSNRIFKVDLADGEYTVKMIIGDNNYRHDNIDVYDGRTLKIDDLSVSAGSFAERTFGVVVSGGQLNLGFVDDGGTDVNWVINAITIEPGAAPPPAGPMFDFGTSTSPVEFGYRGVTESTIYSPALGYGWTTGAFGSRDRGAPDSLRRDLVFSSVDRSFNVDLANGEYTVKMIIGDNNYRHDNIDVYAEGILKLNDVTVSAGSFAERTFGVLVSGGQLNLVFVDDGGTDVNWVINAITIESAP